MRPSEQRLPRPTAAIWDMDGTLIDQTAGIVRCYSEVFQEFGVERPAPEMIRRSLGGPMAETMALFIDAKQLDAACLRFRKLFPSIMYDGLIYFAQAENLVRRLDKHGIKQAILTNKHGDTARQVSQYCGIDKQISICIGNTDTHWHKPQPELTLHVFKELGVSSTGACLIGDSPTDVETALNANITCYGLSTGSHSQQELIEAGASAAFSSASELESAIDW